MWKLYHVFRPSFSYLILTRNKSQCRNKAYTVAIFFVHRSKCFIHLGTRTPIPFKDAHKYLLLLLPSELKRSIFLFSLKIEIFQLEYFCCLSLPSPSPSSSSKFIRRCCYLAKNWCKNFRFVEISTLKFDRLFEFIKTTIFTSTETEEKNIWKW